MRWDRRGSCQLADCSASGSCATLPIDMREVMTLPMVLELSRRLLPSRRSVSTSRSDTMLSRPSARAIASARLRPMMGRSTPWKYWLGSE